MHYQPEARAREEHLLRYLSLGKTDSVVDVGCGTGYFTSLIARRGCNVIGVDMDVEALRVAKKYNPRQDFILADVTNLPFRNRVAGKALCTEVLEHIPNDLKVVKECFRILAGRGVLVCSSPNASFPFGSMKASHTELGPEYHFRTGYSLTGLKELLICGGFRSLKFSYALPTLGTIFVEFMERTYSIIYGPLRSQSELARLDQSRFFKLYKFLSPFILLMVNLSRPCSQSGSILVARSVKVS